MRTNEACFFFFVRRNGNHTLVQWAPLHIRWNGMRPTQTHTNDNRPSGKYGKYDPPTLLMCTSTTFTKCFLFSSKSFAKLSRHLCQCRQCSNSTLRPTTKKLYAIVGRAGKNGKEKRKKKHVSTSLIQYQLNG